MPKNFIHFGCWNNLNTKKGKELGGLRKVMQKLNNKIEESSPDFIVVAGDNYYPDKRTFETEVNGEIVENKKSIIMDDKLKEGLHLLPQEIPIDMIFGNHDLVTNSPDKQKLFLNEETPEGGNCHILITEMLETRRPNMDYIICKERFYPESGTLILMIDTTLYTSDAKKDLPCYKTYFRQNVEKHPYFPVEAIDTITIEQIKVFQLDQIMKSVSEKKDTIKNIILIGHHPIVGYKFKNDEVGILQDMPEFLMEGGIFANIVSAFGGKPVNYYYLCADLHLYQSGTITVSIGGAETAIKQYIVGTGGTKLDDPLPAEIPALSMPPPITNYVMNEYQWNFGFLECILPEDSEKPLVFNFINIDMSGGKKRRNTKKRRKVRRSNRKSKRS
jgi:hypothetical protein